MFGSKILEVAIGLVLVYLILALICSALSEWIARILALRSRTLEAGVRNLLNDLDDAEGLAKRLYEHPLIRSLYRRGWWDKRLEAISAGVSSKLSDRTPIGSRLPLVNKIPLMDKTPAVTSVPIVRGLRTPKGHEGPSNIPSRTFALTLFDTILAAGSPIGTTGAARDQTDERGRSRALQRNAKETFLALEARVSEFDAPDNVKKALKTILTSAKAETDQWDQALANARTSVERWFDDSMERVAGWYRRKAQLIVLALALAVCLAMNVDTFVIANTLSRDATLRDSIVAAAEARAAAGGDSELSELTSELEGLAVPVGWNLDGEDADPRDSPGSLLGWVVKLFGLLFTAFAVALGAPFWFDLLNRFVNLRGGGGRPARTSEEPSPGPARASPTGITGA